MLRIKGGMKKGWGLRSQNCFNLGTLTFLAYALVKTHILSFMTPPLFARFLRDTISIYFKMRKKGREHKK